MQQDSQTQHISEVQTRYTERLMHLPNVIGTAIGYKIRRGQRTDQLSLVVMVVQKVPEAALKPEECVPPQLDDVVTDVQETGVFSTFSFDAADAAPDASG